MLKKWKKLKNKMRNKKMNCKINANNYPKPIKRL